MLLQWKLCFMAVTMLLKDACHFSFFIPFYHGLFRCQSLSSTWSPRSRHVFRQFQRKSGIAHSRHRPTLCKTEPSCRCNMAQSSPTRGIIAIFILPLLNIATILNISKLCWNKDILKTVWNTRFRWKRWMSIAVGRMAKMFVGTKTPQTTLSGSGWLVLAGAEQRKLKSVFHLMMLLETPRQDCFDAWWG